MSSQLQFRKPDRSGTLHGMRRLSNQRFGDNGITNLEIGNEETNPFAPISDFGFKVASS